MRSMRRRFKDLSIKTKLIAMMVAISSVTLLLSAVSFTAKDLLTARSSLVTEMQTLADIAGGNVAAAVIFDDVRAAGETIARLSVTPDVDAVFIQDKAGKIFAEYIRHERKKALVDTNHNSLNSPTYFDQHLHIIRPIVLDGQPIGSVHVVTNTTRIDEQLVSTVTTGAVLTIVFILLSYMGAAIVHGIISQPILGLTGMVSRISEHQNFGLRMPKTTNDELGVLVDGFNSMIATIEARNSELDNYRLGLERLVHQRTGELESRNRELNDEIQERTRAEQSLVLAKNIAETADRAKSRFLASASHDLRQPLQAFLLYVDVLRSSRDEEQRAAMLDKLDDSLGAMSDLLNGILDISKLEAGVVTAQLTNIPVSEILTFTDEFESLAAQRGIEFRVVRSDAVIHTDPVLLSSILRNFIANAFKYTETGKILVGCRRRPGALRVEVWDTGIGLNLDQQRLIFDEFYQVGNPARDRDQGLGLGLAIVKRTADLMGHSVDVKSEPHRGSVFSIEVPLGARLHLPDHENENDLSINAEGRLVVVIDDDTSVLGAIELLLNSLGCQVVSSEFNETIKAEVERITALCPRVPDLIVADYRLPNNNTGTDVIQLLRDAFGNDVPAILLTGEVSKQFLNDLENEAVHVVHKPVDARKLKSTIANVSSLFRPDSATLADEPSNQLSGQEIAPKRAGDPKINAS